jgi:D-alanyl-D-alanine dipeptidase
MKKLLLIFSIFALGFSAFAQQSESAKGQELRKIGLTNLKDIDKNIVVDLKYSTTDNFTGKNLYGDLHEAYLQPEAAKMLGEVQKKLKESHPEWNLIIYDAARPRSVQRQMWKVVKGTAWQNYVTSPQRISMHNYGVAVDLSIVDENGKPIDMGAGFDEFSEISQPRYEQKFLKEKKLTQAQLNNRLLLRNLMKNAGFRTISNEWWHFESTTRKQAQIKYKVIE